MLSTDISTISWHAQRCLDAWHVAVASVQSSLRHRSPPGVSDAVFYSNNRSNTHPHTLALQPIIPTLLHCTNNPCNPPPQTMSSPSPTQHGSHTSHRIKDFTVIPTLHLLPSSNSSKSMALHAQSIRHSPLQASQSHTTDAAAHFRRSSRPSLFK